MTGSNRRHRIYKIRALPTELIWRLGRSHLPGLHDWPVCLTQIRRKLTVAVGFLLGAWRWHELIVSEVVNVVPPAVKVGLLRARLVASFALAQGTDKFSLVQQEFYKLLRSVHSH